MMITVAAAVVVLFSQEEGIPKWDPKKYPWPMYAHNVRRTGQSPWNGPKTYTAKSSRNWTYTAEAGAAINIQAIVSDRGVYFGTWGVLRRDLSQTPDQWEKSDGKYYGLKLTKRKNQELFPPFLPSHNPVGYLYPGRKKLGRDMYWCGRNNDYLVSYYNGTIEGEACIDPDDGTHYLGRGDGKLYAIDPRKGKVKWLFKTFNPVDPKDPDGGGEIVGGPVMGPGKILYFGTIGIPWGKKNKNNPAHETNAIYAVSTKGKLIWRYPPRKANVSNWLYSPPCSRRMERLCTCPPWAAT